jgi:Uncharacterized protein conserved in bacteria (DUF2330)
MRRPWLPLLAASAALLITAAPALACGGLIGPNGAVNLLRTTTFAGYHEGVEHYVTSFEFSGGGSKFGSIVPLPDIPTDVVKGGDWTLQRLILETDPPRFERFALSLAAGASADKAMVIEEYTVKALDITVLKGGGDAVGTWAEDNGFQLSPDAPEVLDFYAERSPIFMAVRFNLARARKLGIDLGDGTPVHLTIPTDRPWVPLRILALGKAVDERVEADVYLLTDERPNLLPQPAFSRALELDHNAKATPSLLADLRSDKGMGWLPATDMWLTKVAIDGAAGDLRHDLAIDPTGTAMPSAVDAGLTNFIPDRLPVPAETQQWWMVALALLLGAGVWKLADRFIGSKA